MSTTPVKNGLKALVSYSLPVVGGWTGFGIALLSGKNGIELMLDPVVSDFLKETGLISKMMIMDHISNTDTKFAIMLEQYPDTINLLLDQLIMICSVSTSYVLYGVFGMTCGVIVGSIIKSRFDARFRKI